MTVTNPELRVTADALVASCRVRNPHPDGLFVFTTPVRGSGAAVPGSAYAVLSADGNDLRLVLGLSPLPADLLVPQRACGLATGIEPGAERTIEITLPLPVVEWYAYSDPADPAAAEWELVSVYRVLLDIGYVRADELLFVEETDSPGLFEVGGEPIRRVVVPFIPDRPIPVRRLPPPLRPVEDS